jgi:hypothetical protein
MPLPSEVSVSDFSANEEAMEKKREKRKEDQGVFRRT